MIREISERLQGRKRVLNDTPPLEEIMKLLLSQKPDVRGNVNCSVDEDTITTNVPPEMMAESARQKFSMIGGGEYLRIRHQVFRGRNEKHYIDLARGIRYSTYTEVLHHGKQMRYEPPFRKMTIDFLVTE
jgi:hypothetical protein